MQRSSADYLKIEEVAQILRVSTRTVYRRIWSGDLPASKVGGLYYVRRADLNALLEPGQALPSLEPAAAPSAMLKCGACFRLITSEAQVGATCKAPGCERLICSQCLSEGIDECDQHRPSRQQRVQQAEQRLQRGELPLLLTASSARLRELNFLNRLHDRLARLASLVHPVTQEVLNITDWDAILTQGDERAEVMRLAGKVFLDTVTLSQAPLNASLHFRIPPHKNQKGLPLEILIQSLSHIAVMQREGFDSQAFSKDELAAWLVRLSKEAQDNQVMMMVVLAATTGWQDEARRVIQGAAGGRPGGEIAFMHRHLLLYLFDLENGDLIYNLQDDRARQYAELFAPLLPAEELREVSAAIETQLGNYDSLALNYAAETMPYSRELLKRAFERMAGFGEYKLVEIPEDGLTLVRN